MAILARALKHQKKVPICVRSQMTVKYGVIAFELLTKKRHFMRDAATIIVT